MSAMRVCVPGAQYCFWGSEEFPFPVIWLKGLHFWRDSKLNSRCYWRCLLSWQVLFQQREMRISWRLCNDSEIHWWLWKKWSLVVCSQSSFYVTMLQEHVRTTKTDKTRFFLVPNNLLSHFNQPNIEKKNCVWTTKYRRLLEMCIVQHGEMKSLLTFQRIKRPVFTTSFYDLRSTYRKSWSSQSRTTESSRLPIFVPTLLLLQ